MPVTIHITIDEETVGDALNQLRTAFSTYPVVGQAAELPAIVTPGEPVNVGDPANGDQPTTNVVELKPKRTRKSKDPTHSPAAGGDVTAAAGPDTPSASAVNNSPDEPAAQEPAALTAGESESKGSTPTKVSEEDARTALGALNSKHGLQLAKDALSRFGAAKFSDLTPDQYGEFVALCNTAVETGEV